MFAESVVETLGAKLLVPDEVVERLVACSQAFKITTVSDITKETGWTNEDNWVEELGESLLAILHEHFPLPLPEIPVTTENGTPPAKQKGSCTACGATDHIRKSYNYYLYFLILANALHPGSNSKCPMKQRSYPPTSGEPDHEGNKNCPLRVPILHTSPPLPTFHRPILATSTTSTSHVEPLRVEPPVSESTLSSSSSHPYQDLCFVLSSIP